MLVTKLCMSRIIAVIQQDIMLQMKNCDLFYGLQTSPSNFLYQAFSIFTDSSIYCHITNVVNREYYFWSISYLWSNNIPMV